MIIFPTDDVFLTEDQFEVVISLLRGEEKLYFMNFGYDKNKCQPMNEIYELAGRTYEEYCSAREFVFVMPLTILSSDSFRWLIVIDENFESGTAVFAADKEIINIFKDKYVNWPEDVVVYEEFCRKYNYESLIHTF